MTVSKSRRAGRVAALEDFVGSAWPRRSEIDLAAVVQPVPLPVDGAVVADAQAEGGRVLGVQPAPTSASRRVFQPDQRAAGRDHQRAAVQGDVARAEELLAVGHAALEVLGPSRPRSNGRRRSRASP